MLRKVLALLIGAALGLSLSYGAAAAYDFYNRPAPLKPYHLIVMQDSTEVDIEAEGFVVNGSCVTFFRKDKRLSFCNTGVVILEEKKDQEKVPNGAPVINPNRSVRG